MRLVMKQLWSRCLLSCWLSFVPAEWKDVLWLVGLIGSQKKVLVPALHSWVTILLWAEMLSVSCEILQFWNPK